MSCTSPVDAWPAAPGAADRRLVFSPMRSYSGAKAISLPCGKCDSCLKARARQWATRIVHEASLHDESWFVTLTYAPEHLPADLSVSKREHQLFMKRVRDTFGPVRFFMRAEYGEQFARPHYHYILFGLPLPDAVPWKESGSGEMLFRSAAFESVWPFGQCLLGSVTTGSASYCAGYVNKKAAGLLGDDPLRRFGLPDADGVIPEWRVAPEFVLMSRRPGIGDGWFSRFKGDAFPSDFVVINGERRPVPRFYKSRLSDDEKRHLVVPARRQIERHAEENTTRRLLTRAESARLKLRARTRDFEDA